MPHLRDVLNEIKWTKDLNKTELWYVHRGAPNDTKILSGKDVIRIGKSSIDTITAIIPYHRIFKIVYEGTIIFQRYVIIFLVSNHTILMNYNNKNYLLQHYL